MTATQQFIEDAIEGKWREDAKPTLLADGTLCLFTCTLKLSYSEILLDPKAWQAVGKVRGWENIVQGYKWTPNDWHTHWHDFINHRADGKTIEQALQLIIKEK